MMCLAHRRLAVQNDRMGTKTPIYRMDCVVCGRPALTLDDAGDAYCGGHADVFIAIDDTPDGIDEVEISILLMHRPLLAEIR